MESLKNAPTAALKAERSAILNRANSSQLEPYDYHLSLRHQASNTALHERSDVNQTIREIDWIKDVSQAQYRSQLNSDPSFTPERRLSATPNWVNDQLKNAERTLSPAPKISKTEKGQNGSQIQPLTLIDQSFAKSRTASIQSETQQAAPEVVGPSRSAHSDRQPDVLEIRLATAVVSSLVPQQATHQQSLIGREEDAQAAPFVSKTEAKPNRQVNLRPGAETFESAERLTSTMLGNFARTIPAQTDSGVYRGTIIAETADLLLQRLSGRAVVAHVKGLFEEGQSPRVGTNISAVYSNNKPVVRELKNVEKTIAISR